MKTIRRGDEIRRVSNRAAAQMAVLGTTLNKDNDLVELVWLTPWRTTSKGAWRRTQRRHG